MSFSKRFVALLLFSGLLLGAGSDAGSSAFFVHEVKAHLMPRTSRFGKPVKVLGLGTKLTLVDDSQADGGWLKVRTEDGAEGFIPLQAVTHGDRQLRAGSSAGADKVHRGSVQLAARGFSQDVEQESRKAHPELDYTLVDAIEASGPGPELVTRHAEEGGLRLEAEVAR
ncbi:MAG: SH3 domain-containing protein [Deltaproteobacteria bacterium]|nr:SH3 domain-containing protein [Deltaproteobacteria bacterium]